MVSVFDTLGGIAFFFIFSYVVIFICDTANDIILGDNKYKKEENGTEETNESADREETL